MKRFLVACFALLLFFCISISLASAKTSSVAASIPHAPDTCNPAATTCPATATPQPGGGSQGGHSGDEDGDGIPDGIDQCPNDGGPSSNQGCPVGGILTTAGTPSQVVLPSAPLFGPCVMATRTDERVNLHYDPSLSAHVVPFGWLDPTKFYTVGAKVLVSDGTIWYLHYYPQLSGIPFGFALSTVVRLGGDCSKLNVIHWPAEDSNPPQVSYDGVHIGLIKGSDPGSDTPRGYCSPAYGIDVTASEGGNANQPGANSGFEYGGLSTIHVTFGDGSVQPNPAQGCIKLNPDGHSFDLMPPDTCKITQANPACIAIHGDLGYIDNQLSLLTFLQPTTSPDEPADTSKPGVLLVWNLAPPDVCKTGDQSCHTQDGALHFTVNFSVENPNTRTGAALMMFSWNTLPLAPCKTGDQSCARGLGTQAVLLNFVPAVQDNAMHFDVAYFPGGFDPNVGGFTLIENQPGSSPGDEVGFTLIENQPGGSNPGDIYGFTLIENQPLNGQITVRFALPSVP